jgi:hypothetical protein
MSSLEISRTYSVNKGTAWLLRQKTQGGMFSSGNNLLKNDVHIDEYINPNKPNTKTQFLSTFV